MSADGSIELVLGGDLRRFRLDIANLIALQEKVGRGPLEIATALQLGNWRVEFVIETLRLGLIGGGSGTAEEAKAAKKLVDDNVTAGNITPHVLTSLAVLLAALQGVPDDPVGKKQRRRTTAARTGSPPPRSTEPEPLWASPPTRSDE